MKQDKKQQQNTEKLSGADNAYRLYRKAAKIYFSGKLVFGIFAIIFSVIGIFGLVYALQHGIIAMITSVLK